MNDFTTKAEQRLDRDYRLASLYNAKNLNGTRKYLTTQIAAAEGVSETTVKRAARRFGVIQSHEQANAEAVRLKRPGRVRRGSRHSDVGSSF